MMLKRYFLFPVIFLMTFPGTAQAACEPVLDIPSASARAVDYDPFSNRDTPADIRFRLANHGDTECRLRLNLVTEDNSNRLRGPGGSLTFTVVNSSGWNLSRQGAALASVQAIVPPGDTGMDKSLSLTIPEGQVVAPGAYRQGLRIVMEDLSGEGMTNRESRAADLMAHVMPRAEAVLSFSKMASLSGGSVTVFDLGTLHSGLTDTIYLQLRANAPARIGLSSQNGGELRHKQDPTLKAIDYDLSVDHNHTDLTTPFSVTAEAPPDLRGRSVPLTFRIGDVKGRMAGIYSDTIHVTVTAY